MTKQLSIEEAIRLSRMKWQAHVDAGGYCREMPDEIKKLKGDCGFCQRWRINEVYPLKNCQLCELGKIAGECVDNDSLYSFWCDRMDVESAERMLNVLDKIELNK